MTILLEINSEAQEYFENLRQQYFPKHKKRDNAHITILYQVHESEEKVIKKLSAFNFNTLDLTASKLIGYPNGNAIGIQSEGLLQLQASLKKLFKGKLIKKDYIKYKPHITYQLHVTAYKAQRTLAEVSELFTPFTFQGIGLSVWQKDNKAFRQVWQKSFT